MRGGIVRNTRPDRVPRPAIDNEIVAQREDMALVVKADFNLVQLIARMRRRRQVLVPVLEPAHRPPEPSRQKRDQQILGIDMTLDAETAADIESEAAHPRFREAEDRGGLPADPMHDLGGRPDRYRVGSRFVEGDDATALDRHCRVSVMIKSALQPVRCAGH